MLRHREKRLELEAQIAAAKARSGRRRERLEQRVRVLERIVTDKGIGVADEIERLASTVPAERSRGTHKWSIDNPSRWWS